MRQMYDNKIENFSPFYIFAAIAIISSCGVSVEEEVTEKITHITTRCEFYEYNKTLRQYLNDSDVVAQVNFTGSIFESKFSESVFEVDKIYSGLEIEIPEKKLEFLNSKDVFSRDDQKLDESYRVPGRVFVGKDQNSCSAMPTFEGVGRYLLAFESGRLTVFLDANQDLYFDIVELYESD